MIYLTKRSPTLKTTAISQLLVIAAKRNDLDYGFTQLIAELIALDLWERSPKVEQQPELVGAITTVKSQEINFLAQSPNPLKWVKRLPSELKAHFSY